MYEVVVEDVQDVYPARLQGYNLPCMYLGKVTDIHTPYMSMYLLDMDPGRLEGDMIGVVGMGARANGRTGGLS